MSFLKKGFVFTGKWFDGKVEVVSVNGNDLVVRLNDSWQETWNLKHTIVGFDNGDYFCKQNINHER